MSTEEFRTQMTLWSVAAAPLVIGERRAQPQPEPSTSSPTPTSWPSTRIGPACKPPGSARRGRLSGVVEAPRRRWPCRCAAQPRRQRAHDRHDGARRRAARRPGSRCWTRGPTSAPRHKAPSGPRCRRTGSVLFRVEPARGRPGEPHVTLGVPRVTAVNGTGVTSDDRGTVVAAGDSLRVEVDLVNDGSQSVDHVAVDLAVPAGWQVDRQGSQQSRLNGGRSTTAVFSVAVPDAAVTGQAALSATASYLVPGLPKRPSRARAP